MIRELLRDDTNFEGVDSSGKKSATRYLVYSCDKGDSTMLLAESNLIPRIGDAHPQYSGWTVESISAPKYDSVEPRFLFTVKYTWGGSSGGGGSSNNTNVAPWELGPQNVKTSTFEKDYQIDQIWSPLTKKWEPFYNSAGCRIIQTGQLPVLQLSFTQNYKHTVGKWREANIKVSINAKDIKVCGLNIKAGMGKLHPFTPELHTVYENDGKTIKWQYETVNYTIDILTSEVHTWEVSVLNVGRLARFNRGGKLSSPEPIYKYTPWEKEDDMKKIDFGEKYGGMTEVQTAQNIFYQNGGKVKIPWSQIDEDLPLRLDGTIYEEAMKDPQKNPYLKLEGFLVVPEYWDKYNLPRSV